MSSFINVLSKMYRAATMSPQDRYLSQATDLVDLERRMTKLRNGTSGIVSRF